MSAKSTHLTRREFFNGLLEGLELGNGREASIFRHRGEIPMVTDTGRVGNGIKGFYDFEWVSGPGVARDKIEAHTVRMTDRYTIP